LIYHLIAATVLGSASMCASAQTEIEPQIKDVLIAREVFLQEANKLGLTKDADFKLQPSG